jgi:hypothetical protein
MFVKLAVRCILIGILLTAALPVEAQFTSGSTGTDGALDYSSQPPGTTIMFNPATFSHTATQPVYNFTTITIPSGVTVRLSGAMNPAPVIWLASGAVQIAGNVDISGSTGGCLTPTECRTPSVPGAGGSPGGVGGGSTTTPPEPGLGPGGGAPGTASTDGQGGTLTGNSLLIPLVGGSGGGGNWGGGGGGAGGGALLIASSVSINLTGSIYAQGGSSVAGLGGGGGSGGAIRLAAPTISGNGTLFLFGGLYAGGCRTDSLNGGPGVARIESYNGWNFGIHAECNSVSDGAEYLAAPYSTFISSLGPTTITVTSVNNIRLFAVWCGLREGNGGDAGGT